MKKKKSAKKIVLTVIGVFAACIVLFICVTSIIGAAGRHKNLKTARSFDPAEYESDRIVPETDGEGNYCIFTDRELKIIQLTDVHLGGGWMSTSKDFKAINAVASMLTEEKPGLVIVTGDIAYPVPFQSGTINNKASARLFAELMEKLGIYWTLCFGNHDTELYSLYDREDMAEFYGNGDYRYCLFTDNYKNIDGYGNQIIHIKNKDGSEKRTLYILDSHSYTDGDYLGIMWKYDNIHDNQIQWYSDCVKAFDTQDNENVPSSVFMHIPMNEYADAWKSYVRNGCRDTDEIKLINGTAGCEGRVVYCPYEDDDMFETALSLGSTDSFFCGHDHRNNFALEYKGITLTYGMSVDYLAIPGISKIGTQRGCKIITVSPDGSISSENQNYYQDKYSSKYEKESVTMQTLEIQSEFDEQN